MNWILYNFYSGNGIDVEGRDIYQMIQMFDHQLERSHTLIQWLFPLTEPSQHNKKAPILDYETIELMKQNMYCMHNLKDAFDRFMRFFENGQAKPFWITPGNHNYLRITRIIRCLKLFQLEEQAREMYDMAMDYYNKYPDEVGSKTVEFWERAITT